MGVLSGRMKEHEGGRLMIGSAPAHEGETTAQGKWLKKESPFENEKGICSDKRLHRLISKVNGRFNVSPVLKSFDLFPGP